MAIARTGEKKCKFEKAKAGVCSCYKYGKGCPAGRTRVRGISYIK